MYQVVFMSQLFFSGSDFFIYGCDFSQVAIDLLKSNESFDPKRSNVFVMDAASDVWKTPFPENSLDVILMVYTLSAVDPKKYERNNND